MSFAGRMLWGMSKGIHDSPDLSECIIVPQSAFDRSKRGSSRFFDGRDDDGDLCFSDKVGNAYFPGGNEGREMAFDGCLDHSPAGCYFGDGYSFPVHLEGYAMGF